mmetsp:Transcript_10158/g.13426  ORF Transcript_10158/g.13426 Transcript_10158/m.13426 type:complete len:80 (+) Transcript_10158:1348-1587(+)
MGSAQRRRPENQTLRREIAALRAMVMNLQQQQKSGGGVTRAQLLQVCLFVPGLSLKVNFYSIVFVCQFVCCCGLHNPLF